MTLKNMLEMCTSMNNLQQELLLSVSVQHAVISPACLSGKASSVNTSQSQGHNCITYRNVVHNCQQDRADDQEALRALQSITGRGNGIRSCQDQVVARSSILSNPLSDHGMVSKPS
jgi:hypothetical protein